MDITSNNQLVPYNRGPTQLTPNSPRNIGAVAADSYAAAKRYVLMPPSHSPGYKIHSGDQDLIYTSSRQIKAQETEQVGLRINIFA
jgi:hypothetical protein